MVSMRTAAVALALSAPILVPSDAAAENGVKPRIPVTWSPAPACLEFVDRSADPVYAFEYSILDEDPSPGEELLPDEVDDSRRHQFFAFSRQGNQQTEFPYNWVSAADVQAAVDKGLINETTVGPQETLETSPLWENRFVRITPDDQRRPISNESVAAPVLWDTSDVDAGVYQLWGYTWEPAFNEWAQRSGNVVIVHDGDPHEVGPAAAIIIRDFDDLIVYSDQAANIGGCVHALPGTTVDGYFSETPGNSAAEDWQPTWIPFAEDVAIEGESFGVEFTPGDGHATPTLLVRLVFNDPQGRSYEAYLPEVISWLPGSKGGCDSGGGNFVGMPGCGGDSSGSGETSDSAGESDSDSGTQGGSGTTSAASTTSGADSGSSGTTGPAGAEDGGSGGTCAVSGGGAPPLMLIFGLFALRRRR